MKKFQILGMTLVAVFALAAVVSSSAFAETGMLWLVNKAEVTGPVAADTTGELLLEDMKEKVDVKCKGLFEGTVSSEGEGTITGVEGEKGEKGSVTCTFVEKGICEGTTTTVTPVNLPWKTELMLHAAPIIWWILIFNSTNNPGYEVVCKVPLIGTEKDVCTADTGAEAKNNTGETEVEANFLTTNEEITPPANCSLGGTKEGLVGNLTTGLIKTVSGLSLSMSEP